MALFGRDGIERSLDALFADVFRMTDAELTLVRLGWEDADGAQRRQLWDRMRLILADGAAAELMDEARSRLASWVNSYLSATAIEYGNFLINAGSGMNPTEVRRAAIPPTLDAVAAIVAGHVLDLDERELLLGPINDVREHRRSA